MVSKMSAIRDYPCLKRGLAGRYRTRRCYRNRGGVSSASNHTSYFFFCWNAPPISNSGFPSFIGVTISLIVFLSIFLRKNIACLFCFRQIILEFLSGLVHSLTLKISSFLLLLFGHVHSFSDFRIKTADSIYKLLVSSGPLCLKICYIGARIRFLFLFNRIINPSNLLFEQLCKSCLTILFCYIQ